MSRMNWMWPSGCLALVVAIAFVGRSMVHSRAPSALTQAGIKFPISTASAIAPQAPANYRVDVPAGPPRIPTDEFDSLGRPITVSCSSCHSNLQPNRAIRTGEDLREFHVGLTFNHGGQTCLSCHNDRNYNLLRLADGRDIDFSNVRTMCSQCHSKQAMDWERGAHGGMNGYWDQTRGERIRKICIDCHDPHAPKFPAMRPTFWPKDRFLTNSAKLHGEPE